METKQYIYLDDVRVPVKVREDEQDWVVVRSYDEFVETISRIGIDNVELVSLDHDLGPLRDRQRQASSYGSGTQRESCR